MARFASAWPRMSSLAAVVFGLLIAALPASARAEPLAAACTKTYAPQTLDLSQPINLGQVKAQAYFYACSGAYDAELAKVLGDARAYLETRAAQVSKPALVLDIDETSLSNLPVELADDFAYLSDIACQRDMKVPCGFDNWIETGWAKAIDGTLALFNAAKAHHVAVFFITGRPKGQEMATVKNLDAVGYKGRTGLIFRPDNDNRSVTGYKSDEREKIANQGYTIIVNVGDQRSDLDGGYAERAYKLPNPFYYIP